MTIAFPWLGWLLAARRGYKPLGAVVLAAATAISATAIYTTTQATPPASANWAGTFDCFGSTTNCPSSSASATCNNTLSSGGNIATAISGATAGQAVCLGAGTYGATSVASVTKSSDVIVQPVNGATVNVGKVSFSGTVSHIRFSGQGGTMNVAGIGSGEGDKLSHITFDHINFTDCVNIWLFDTTTVGNVFDHDRWDGLKGASQCTSGIVPDDHAAFEVSDFDTDPGTYAITLSNSLINNHCGDGVHLRSPGVVIGPGNAFTNIHDSNCSDGTHVDSLQCGGNPRLVVYDNIFYNNSDALQCGAGLGSEHNVTVYNNVMGNDDHEYSNPYWACACGANVDNHFEHNYMYGGECIGKDTGHSPSGDVAINNVWNAGTGGIGVGCQDGFDGDPCPGCSSTYNMNVGSETAFAGTGTLTENPVKLVSASPTTNYYDYALSPTSSGYNTGSDGKPRGICSTCGPPGF
jgi:hypothetical protein